MRDTGEYPPLRRATTGKPAKLRELTRLHLGYDIQREGAPHDPREDAVAAMRLYRWVLSQARICCVGAA